MALEADLSRLTARQLEIAWFIAKREDNKADLDRINREAKRRGIRVPQRRKKST